MEVDGSNDFPFQTGDVQVPAVNFPGCRGKATKWIQHDSAWIHLQKKLNVGKRRLRSKAIPCTSLWCGNITAGAGIPCYRTVKIEMHNTIKTKIQKSLSSYTST